VVGPFGLLQSFADFFKFVFKEIVIPAGANKTVFILAPLVTYVLVLASGTQHVIYALLPVIAEVARKAGVRPERPLSMSVIASQQGLVASPISAATVALIGGLASTGVSLPKVLVVIIPATSKASSRALVGRVAWARARRRSGVPAAARRGDRRRPGAGD
jgi:anaerobic C4-dicarboxylate transporter